MNGQFITNVFVMIWDWFIGKVKEYYTNAKDLILANTNNEKVIEFFIMTLLVGSFISFGEKVNGQLKEIISKGINNSPIFSTIANTPLVWKLANEYVSYYLVQGAIIYIVLVLIALVAGVWAGFCFSITKEDKIKFYKKIILRYFYCWILVFVIPNLLLGKSIFLFGHSSLSVFVISFMVYLFFIRLDFKEMKKVTWFGRAFIISLSLALADLSLVKLSSSNKFRARAMYFALEEIKFENAKNVSSIFFSFEHSSLVPNDYKNKLYKYAKDLNIKDVDEKIILVKIKDHCRNLTSKPIGYNSKPCEEFNDDVNLYSSILEQIKEKGDEDADLLTMFPVEKYFKMLI